MRAQYALLLAGLVFGVAIPAQCKADIIEVIILYTLPSDSHQIYRDFHSNRIWLTIWRTILMKTTALAKNQTKISQVRYHNLFIAAPIIESQYIYSGVQELYAQRSLRRLHAERNTKSRIVFGKFSSARCSTNTIDPRERNHNDSGNDYYKYDYNCHIYRRCVLNCISGRNVRNTSPIVITW